MFSTNEKAEAKVKGFICKHNKKTNCECFYKDDYMVVRQKQSDDYNAYKLCGKGCYTSIHKPVIRVEVWTDEDGKEQKTNVLGAKSYVNLSDAMDDCK